jgi:hypothetical protein
MKLCEHCPLHPPKVPCVECARPFRPTRGARPSMYCSPACREQGKARKQLEYQKVYRDRERKAQAAASEPATNGAADPKAVQP